MIYFNFYVFSGTGKAGEPPYKKKKSADNRYGLGNAETGPCFTEMEQIDGNLIASIRDSDRIIPTYDNNTVIYLKSGTHYGDIKVYESKFGTHGSPCIMVKKGEIVNELRRKVEEKIKQTVNLFGKSDAEFMGCFIDTVGNCNGERCVVARVNGKPELIPTKDLNSKTGEIFAVLKSKPLKKSDANPGYVWGFTVCELSIDPLPKDYQGYFKTVNKPNLQFLSKMD